LVDRSLVISLAKPMVRRWEGLSLVPYRCPAGVLTIGYGHVITSKDEWMKGGITKQQAEEILEKDLERVLDGVLSLLEVELPSECLAALVSFCFNVGLGAFRGSTMRRLINQGRLKEAANEFDKWVYAYSPKEGRKVVLRGLVRRRADEKQLFLQGVEKFAGKEDLLSKIFSIFRSWFV